MKNVLILGIGNLVLNDAGVGVHIVHMLKSLVMPHGVDVLDGGVGNETLIDIVCEYNHLIWIEAAVDGSPVGTVRRFSPQYPADYQQLLHNHEPVVRNMIDSIHSHKHIPHVDMLSISVHSNPTIGIELSPEVRRVIPQVMQLIFEILEDTRTVRYFR
ncbi:MAG: hydrogenase maturation protease [Bacteroidaceae bacterium]|nr:hydrogenase maturation protease [Bacteroidaceae bacterium]